MVSFVSWLPGEIATSAKLNSNAQAANDFATAADSAVLATGVPAVIAAQWPLPASKIVGTDLPVSTAQQAAISAALSGQIAHNSPVEEVALFAYGDSFVAGTGTTNSQPKFATRLGDRINAITTTNSGVSGTNYQQMLANTLTALPASVPQRGLYIVNTGINSIINTTSAQDSREQSSFAMQMKGALRVLRGQWIPATDASITYTGTWTTPTVAMTRSGTPKLTSTSGNSFSLASTLPELSVALIGFGSTNGGGTFTVTVNGSAYTPEVSTTNAVMGYATTWAPLLVRIVNPSPGTSMTIVFTSTSTASFYCDGYVNKLTNPSPILVSRIVMPTQTGLNVNGADTNRTPAGVNTYNAMIDSILASPEFSSDGLVVEVDPATAGFDNNTMRYSDSLHPNNIGHSVFAYAYELAARALPFSVGLNL